MAGDAVVAWQRLDPSVLSDDPRPVAVEYVELQVIMLVGSCNSWVKYDIGASPKTLMSNNRVDILRDKRAGASPEVFRGYLLIAIPSRRLAFMHFLLVNHNLAIERLC